MKNSKISFVCSFYAVILFFVVYSHSLDLPLDCDEYDLVTCTPSNELTLPACDKFRFVTNVKLSSIVSLDLSRILTATTFPREIFVQLRSLESLYVTSVGIEYVTKEDLVGANNLDTLYLNFNGIKFISSDFISLAPVLTTLDLSSNRIKFIEDDAFKSQTLQSINLSDNNLKVLRKGMFWNARNIRDIYLDKNLIDTIEEGTFDLPTLTTIDLRWNHLKILPSNLFVNSKMLTSIYLQFNQLIKIKDILLKVPSLKQVEFHNNPNLKDEILSSLHLLPQLSDLDLDNTGLVVRNVNRSHKLKKLKIQNNHLSDSKILRRLKELKGLEVLFMGQNLFRKLDEFDKIKDYLPNLKIILLDNNKWDCKWVVAAKKICSQKKIYCGGLPVTC